jgi:N-methylhydantoinase A
VATNALIERKGARTALFTTKGIADLIEIGRQTRPSLYDLKQGKPEPVIPGHLRYEVNERTLATGEILRRLDEAEVRDLCRAARSQGISSIAVCFLFSYLNPDAEQSAVRIIREEFQDVPDFFVSASHEVVSEFREYPRLSTTALNAYLGPTVKRYMQSFAREVRALGVGVDPYIMQSNGGIISVTEASERPVKTVLSGPSAGVVAATGLSNILGLPNLITLDMGGTSTDISLVVDHQPQVTHERSVEGFPARTPMIDITAIGAGGGSIAHLDAGGALKVGPESAGAVPGPACYVRGGTRPTVTDANLILGRLGVGSLLNGTMTLNAEVARHAIDEHVCRVSGLSTLVAAQGILSVVNGNMTRAIRVVTVERGYDPREFALVAFGGAGPLHATVLARELGIPRVIVPTSPGMMCSLGLLQSDIRTDFVRSRRLPPGPNSVRTIRGFFEEMRAEANRVLDGEGIPANMRLFQAAVEARYGGQNYELSVSLDPASLASGNLDDVTVRFHEQHQKKYGHSDHRQPVEFVTYRLTAVGHLPKASLHKGAQASDGAPKPFDERPVYFETEERFVSTPLYRREEFRGGHALEGPAVIEQMDSTTVVHPGQHVDVDSFLNLHILHGGRQ